MRKIKVSQITEFTDDIVSALLFEGLSYDGRCGDLIMVLGSRRAVKYRIPAAAELFKAGKAPMVLLTGGKVQETGIGVMSEHIAMHKTAVELGIPADKIITEDRSLSTVENFIFSRDIIKEKMPSCKSIILVTTDYHMRRALCMAKKLMPGYEFIPYPAHGGSTAKDNWAKDPKGRKTALDECKKFGYYIKEGFIDDFEI